MKFEGQNGEFIEVVNINMDNSFELNASKKSELSLLWFTSDNNLMDVDNTEYELNTNDILSLTEFHQIEARKIQTARLIRWNRDFYCIVDHDSEVSCKGILYYGATTVPIMKPSQSELDTLETVFKLFVLEIDQQDNLQLEMLQMMLKRLLILCTRIYKTQNTHLEGEQQNIDIIREYNYLVEKHFKEKHTVNEYADLLNKSPKTLSNLFKKHGTTTPLQFIQNRIMLEAKRLLNYTEHPISSIGYDLGFSDVQVFSRFFKTRQGCSPQNYREREKLTTA